MQLIKPNRLQIGDKVGILSPAGAVKDGQLDAMVTALEELGLIPEIHQQNYQDIGYLAGDDETRLQALHDFFIDDKIKAIFCVRGGYGVSRLLTKIDYDLIRKNPKILVGMSDITVLQSAILAKAGLETYHGPVASHFLGEKRDFAIENLRKILFNDEKKIELVENIQLNDFRVSGKLVGGNLTILSHLIGTEYSYDYKNSILLLEDVGVFHYAFDRMMIQLKLAGVFDNVKAIVVGELQDRNNDIFAYSFEDVLKQHIPKNIPVIQNAKFSHQEHHLTLPIGREVTLELTNGKARLIL